MAADAIADGDDRGEVVVLDIPGNLAASFGSNYSILSNSCRRVQFLLGVKLTEVVVYGVHADLEEFGHQGLREPERLPLEAALDPRAPVLGLV